MNIQELFQSLGEDKERVLSEAMNCKSAEEILALASKNNLSISESEATAIVDKLQIKEGELSDDELDMVAGGKPSYGSEGCPGPENSNRWKCLACKDYIVIYENGHNKNAAACQHAKSR